MHIILLQNVLFCNRGCESYQNRIKAVTEQNETVVIEVTKPIKIVVIMKAGSDACFFVRRTTMRWITIPNEYLDFLRSKEHRIPRSNYGSNHFKPFFGVLFETASLLYVTQVSSAKEHHYKMKENLDFHKLHQKKDNKLLAVINLNYMFPVPKELVTNLDYSRMEEYRTFNSFEEKSRYISFLKAEMKLINELDIAKAARRVYEIKNNYPDSSIARRCINFRELEHYALIYQQILLSESQFQENKIKDAHQSLQEIKEKYNL